MILIWLLAPVLPIRWATCGSNVLRPLFHSSLIIFGFGFGSHFGSSCLLFGLLEQFRLEAAADRSGGNVSLPDSNENSLRATHSNRYNKRHIAIQVKRRSLMLDAKA
ncbi:MAG: hypothetical protein L6R42_001835 [Xanthoria sp. 1 TBL-2021]|nr:MAG: hypothetical protein L6R42_001835 [Xanthoria sp. 1 TBL-2021]